MDLWRKNRDTLPPDNLTLPFIVMLLAWIKSKVFVSKLFVNERVGHTSVTSSRGNGVVTEFVGERRENKRSVLLISKAFS